MLNLPDRGCDICGAMYTPVRRTQRYCSKKCSNRQSNLYRAVKRKKVCKYCGKDMTGTMDRAKICSDECRIALRKDQMKIYNAKARQARRSGLPTRFCKYCENPLDKVLHRGKLYCSVTCRYRGGMLNNMNDVFSIENLDPPSIQNPGHWGWTTKESFVAAQGRDFWRIETNVVF